MRELESPFDLSESPILEDLEFHTLSGGGQGQGKQPKEKIRGSQDRAKREKIINIPKIRLPKIINPFSRPK